MSEHESVNSTINSHPSIPLVETGKELETSMRYVDKQWEVMDEIIRLGLQITNERSLRRENADHDL